MATLDEIRNRILADKEYTTLKRMVDGREEIISDSERLEIIEQWAQNEYNEQQVQFIRENGGVSENYAQFRREAYPSLPDQLDMIYHDSVDGTTTWKDAIAAVKAKYRKP